MCGAGRLRGTGWLNGAPRRGQESARWRRRDYGAPGRGGPHRTNGKVLRMVYHNMYLDRDERACGEIVVDREDALRPSVTGGGRPDVGKFSKPVVLRGTSDQMKTMQRRFVGPFQPCAPRKGRMIIACGPCGSHQPGSIVLAVGWRRVWRREAGRGGTLNILGRDDWRGSERADQTCSIWPTTGLPGPHPPCWTPNS